MKLEDFTDVSTEIITQAISEAKGRNKPAVPEFLLREMLAHESSPVPSILIHHKIETIEYY